MSGAGNTFAVTDEKGLTAPAQLAKQLCAATKADGFIALRPAENADFSMEFYNQDGSRASLCGNGLRCLCRFAFDRGLAGEAMQVQTDAGILRAFRLSQSCYRVQLGPTVPPVFKDGIFLVTLGVPHAVVPLKVLDFSMAAQLRPRARALRRKWDANVDFFAPTAGSDLRILTYERGVEDFTAACGTGCGAVSLALGRPIRGENRGGILSVDMESGWVYLTGSTEVLKVFTL